MNNTSYIPYDFLSLDKEYLEGKQGQTISTGFPIILLLYSLLLPILIICWGSTIRYLRNRGYLTSSEAEDIVQNFPLVSRRNPK